MSHMARAGILASMAVLPGVLLSRRQLSRPKGCGLDLPCSHCRKWKDCRLPEAETARRNEKG
jgi:hypothetical protein